MIFLDNNSTTQIDTRVLKEIIPYFNQTKFPKLRLLFKFR